LKKIFLSFLIILSFSSSTLANEIDKYIKQNDFELKSTVSIFVENDKKVLYKKNPEKLLNPASILKILTFGSSYLTLGEDYNFETSIYKDSQNNLYLKLGGDILLSTNDLIDLFNQVKKNFNISKINNIYIDDTIIDKTPYPTSWMEEDVWPYQRAVTPYIIDNNFTEIAIKRSSLATKVDIIQNDSYKIPIINELKLGDKQDYKIAKLYGENSSIIGFSGIINKDELIKLPVLKPEINFNIKLRKALDKAEIKYFNKITSKKTPKNVYKIATIEHNIKSISKPILLASDNFSAEVIFRVAAAKYINYSHSATLDDAINMFNCVFNINDDTNIKIADGSGVSRYNLINTKTLVELMEILFKDEDFKNLLATSNQGTLKDRLLFLENNLRAKTGTLSNMSSIAGTLKTKSNHDITFAIIIQNSPKRKAILKNFENNIISILYRKY